VIWTLGAAGARRKGKTSSVTPDRGKRQSEWPSLRGVSVRVNATLDEQLLRRIDAYAATHLEDRSTAIRQLVDLALRELAKREALGAYEQGRATLRELAQALRLDIWQAQDLLLAEGVAVAQGRRSETEGSLEALLGSSII
jgi:hypothetical protein